jgi:hypothetical protein
MANISRRNRAKFPFKLTISEPQFKKYQLGKEDTSGPELSDLGSQAVDRYYFLFLRFCAERAKPHPTRRGLFSNRFPKQNEDLRTGKLLAT